jgi:hypothetical protein
VEEVLAGISSEQSLESVEIEVTSGNGGCNGHTRIDGTCEFGSQPFATCVSGRSGSIGGSDEWCQCSWELN